MFNNFISLIESLLLSYHYFESASIFLFTLLYSFVLLQCHGDTELNSGPKNLKNKLLSVCHWNINSLTAHNYSNRTQLKACISLYKYDFACLSETYLDSTTTDNLFGKLFEKIIFNRIYNFLLQEELINPNQSGFRPSDSCVYQLIAITHEIFEAFDCNPSLEVRSVFLDISKAFDKVWCEGMLYKLKSMCISAELCNLLENYLFKYQFWVFSFLLFILMIYPTD